MTVLVLNSAQSKYPVGSDTWIQGTIRAVRSLSERDVTFLCSTDPTPWNLVTYLAGKNGMHITLIVKAEEGTEGYRKFARIREEFALEESRSSPLFLGNNASCSTKKVWQLRDRFALRNADVMYPVSIRPGGRLDTLLSGEKFTGDICTDFRVEWSLKRGKLLYDFRNRNVNPLPPGNWLIHWTHASQGPWPGEKAWEFYRDLIEHPSIYVRSAEETLIRVLNERLVRGSSWKLPYGESAVSLTSLDCKDAVPLMRWRKRFVRYSFEPFGIGIKRDILAARGARPVSYKDSEPEVSPSERIFSHAPGRYYDWTKEKEWRIRGDLSLDGIDNDDIIVIVPDATVMVRIQKKINRKYPVHILFKN